MNIRNAALVLIDIQKGLQDASYYGAERNNKEAEQKAARLLVYWRKNNSPIYHVKHNSLHEESPLYPGKDGNEIQSIVKPIAGETVFEKNVNSAFIGTDLETTLKKNKITTLIIAGLTVEHCISTSVRMASNLGFKTYLVEDATAAFSKRNRKGEFISAEQVFEVAIANLNEEFADIISSTELLK